MSTGSERSALGRPGMSGGVVDQSDGPQRQRLAYRTFLRASEPDRVLETVERCFNAWLAEKNLKVGEPTESQRADLSRVSVDGESLLRCRLVESTAAMGDWQSEILASSSGWIHLSVTNSDGRRVDVPRIARALMRELELRDAAMHLEDRVRLWDIDEVDRVVSLLSDPDRNGLVFVAGTGPEPVLYDGFRDRLPIWMRQAYGLAQCILLTPQATWELGERLGMHAVAPWTIRTFLPEVRLGSVADSRRHRYLSIGTLAQEPDGRVRQRLADISRIHAAQRAVPEEVSKALLIFERAATEAVIGRLRPAPGADSPKPSPVPPKVAEHQALEEAARPEDPEIAELEELDLKDIRELLGIQVLTRDTVIAALAQAAQPLPTNEEDLDEALEIMEEQLRRIEALEKDLQSAQSLLDDDLIEQAELGAEIDSAQKQVTELEAQIKFLRGKLIEQGDHADAFAAVPSVESEQLPESCVELVETFTDDPVLVFTGDLAMVEEVDDADGFGMAVREAARACRSLREYARAYADGVASSGVDHFLRHTPSGYLGTSPGKHAQGETQVTKKQFGAERVFSVPTSVEPSGQLLMTAHFKLARIGRLSPRLYYYDDIPRSGRVYIGYLGRHLTNTQSN